MGSRSTSMMGLNSRAQQMVAERIAVESDSQVQGMFGEPYPLCEYVTPDESLRQMLSQRAELLQDLDALESRIQQAAKSLPTQYREYQQAVEWSSGPCIFLALRDEASGQPVAESLWTDEEIAQST